MSIPTRGPGVVLKIEDLLPGDAADISVTKLVGKIVGNYRTFFSGTAVAVQRPRPGGPDVIEEQTSTVAAVGGVVTLTTQPLVWNTSATEANAIGGVYEYTATVAVTGETWTNDYVFRFVLDEQGGYSFDGDGNVSFAQVQSDAEGVALPVGSTALGGVVLALFASDVACETGSAGVGFPVGTALAGRSITEVTAVVHTAGTGGTMTLGVIRRRAGADVRAIETTIDAGEYDSSTAAVADIVTPAGQLLERGDWLTVAIDQVHTSPARGLSVFVTTAVV